MNFSQLMLYREIMVVYCDNYKRDQYMPALWWLNVDFL
jgi:hypothetical protein